MIAAILLLLLVAVLAGLVYKIKTSPLENVEEEQEPDFGAARAGARGVGRMQAGLRRRRAGARAAESDDDDNEHSDDNNNENQPQTEKAFTRRDAYEARRAARDAEREAQEAAQEEEIRKAAEERARREAEEAEKWMHLFTVEGAGEEALSVEAGEEQLKKITEYLINRKTTALEEIAAEFGLKTADAVAKVQALEAEGRITGVMDDRGKFIYVSREEMRSVAEYIKSRGRIAIAELAAKSATFIDLQGKNAAIDGSTDDASLDALLDNN